MAVAQDVRTLIAGRVVGGFAVSATPLPGLATARLKERCIYTGWYRIGYRYRLPSTHVSPVSLEPNALTTE